jgi:hypothetical protein
MNAIAEFVRRVETLSSNSMNLVIKCHRGKPQLFYALLPS